MRCKPCASIEDGAHDLNILHRPAGKVGNAHLAGVGPPRAIPTHDVAKLHHPVRSQRRTGQRVMHVASHGTG